MIRAARFINGDHRYEGVKQGFLCYRHFGRQDGIILFHDICESSGNTGPLSLVAELAKSSTDKAVGNVAGAGTQEIESLSIAHCAVSGDGARRSPLCY